jgi:hypothetical protein
MPQYGCLRQSVGLEVPRCAACHECLPFENADARIDGMAMKPADPTPRSDSLGAARSRARELLHMAPAVAARLDWTDASSGPMARPSLRRVVFLKAKRRCADIRVHLANSNSTQGTGAGRKLATCLVLLAKKNGRQPMTVAADRPSLGDALRQGARSSSVIRSRGEVGPAESRAMATWPDRDGDIVRAPGAADFRAGGRTILAASV